MIDYDFISEVFGEDIAAQMQQNRLKREKEEKEEEEFRQRAEEEMKNDASFEEELAFLNALSIGDL